MERNPAVLLSDILRELDSRVIMGDTACEVTSVEFNSKNVSGGSIFVAIIGFNNDGHSYIGDAIAQGASCVIVDSERKGYGEEELAEMVAGTKCVVAEMKDTKKALALAAASLYGHPEKQMDIYGITGTKGKTTSSFMLRSILEAAGKKAGLIGTVCNIIGDEKVNSVHTTPESSNIFSMMRSLRDKDISNLVMEVSSQGLKLDRVYGISYKAAAFTNLFEDHIGKNEHPDMDDYFNCKLKIFDRCDTAVVNLDCAQAADVIAYASPRCRVLTYGTGEEADFRASDIELERRDHVTGTKFKLTGNYISGEFFVALPGKFNVSNALCAITMAYCAGCDTDSMIRALASISVPGRMQPVENNLGLNILVDYAHNAAALESAIDTLKEYTEGRVITVFGCGGNRSTERRFLMGEVSGRLSDYTVITSDNPREEDPKAIIDNIETGMKKTSGKYEIEPDRASAIRLSIAMAKPGDTVLIAGKGHEDYQIFGKTKIHFDDVEQAYKAVLEIQGGVK